MGLNTGNGEGRGGEGMINYQFEIKRKQFTSEYHFTMKFGIFPFLLKYSRV